MEYDGTNGECKYYKYNIVQIICEAFVGKSVNVGQKEGCIIQ